MTIVMGIEASADIDPQLRQKFPDLCLVSDNGHSRLLCDRIQAVIDRGYTKAPTPVCVQEGLRAEDGQVKTDLDLTRHPGCIRCRYANHPDFYPTPHPDRYPNPYAELAKRVKP